MSLIGCMKTLWCAQFAYNLLGLLYNILSCTILKSILSRVSSPSHVLVYVKSNRVLGKSNNADKCGRELRKHVSVRALCQVFTSLRCVWLSVLSRTMVINVQENLESMFL